MFYLNFIETIFQVSYFTFSISKFDLDFSKIFLTILGKANCLASIHAMAFSLYFSIHVSRIEKAESPQYGQIKHSITFYSLSLLFPRSKRFILKGKAWELLNVVHQRFCNTHHKQQTIAHAIRYTMPLM